MTAQLSSEIEVPAGEYEINLGDDEDEDSGMY